MSASVAAIASSAGSKSTKSVFTGPSSLALKMVQMIAFHLVNREHGVGLEQRILLFALLAGDRVRHGLGDRA